MNTSTFADTMRLMAMHENFVAGVRLRVMDIIRESEYVPDAAEVARAMDVDRDEVVTAFRQLHDGHVFVLEPGRDDRVRMANPFSAVPTPFRAQIGKRSWWGNCIWDGLGVLAALGGSGTLATTCPDCGQIEAVSAANSELRDGSGVAFIGVPARRWWENIIHS